MRIYISIQIKSIVLQNTILMIYLFELYEAQLSTKLKKDIQDI